MNTPPLKPTAMLNFNFVSSELGAMVGNFWKLVWNKENPAIEIKMRYLLSLANAVGARRFRQATRELIKAYAAGIPVRFLDEMFELFAWNEGIGTFASQIGPSILFKAYRFIKEREAEGEDKEGIVKGLVEKYGDRNPEVSTRG